MDQARLEAEHRGGQAFKARGGDGLRALAAFQRGEISGMSPEGTRLVSPVSN
jgi:hypothetical protein